VAESNPFEVLRLDPSSSEEEIVRQAGRLRQRATDEEARNAIRQAVQALTASAADRQLHALLTHPRPAWQSAVLDRFAAAFRRAPAAAGAPGPCPPLDMEEFRSLLYALAAEELDFAPLEFSGLPAGEDPEEVRLLTAEALWQSLLFDPRG
jgi:hypothetical protein